LNIADTGISVVDKVGAAARLVVSVGKPALPFIEFAAGFIPGAAPVLKVLEIAEPIVEKIAAGAPIVEAMIKTGKPAIDAFQAAAPDLLAQFKQLYAIAVNHDPARPETNLAGSDVATIDAIRFAGPILLGRRWTVEEEARWFDHQTENVG
jgi:hypothetical protein